MTVFDPGDGQYIDVGGQLVERDALHIAERLKEYDENLEIMCLDPARSNINDAPFVICCKRPDGTMYRVFEAWKLDESILERIYHSDGHRFDANARVTSINEMVKKLREDRYADKAGQAMEIVEAAVRNRKSSFKFRNENDELVTIHDDKPSEIGNGRSYLNA